MIYLINRYTCLVIIIYRNSVVVYALSHHCGVVTASLPTNDCFVRIFTEMMRLIAGVVAG